MSPEAEPEVIVTAEFLEQVLHRKIKEFSISSGSNPGDNYTSILYALTVHAVGVEQPIHLVMKTYPNLPSRQQFLDETNLFGTEIQVYGELLPELAKFHAHSSDDFVLKPPAPPFIAGKNKELVESIHEMDFTRLAPLGSYVIMSDVRKSGYKMVQKELGLDLKHALLAVKELAKFHALGWAYKERETIPSLTSRFPFMVETCFSSSSVNAMIDENYQVLLNVAKKFFGADSKVVENLKKLENIGTSKVFKAFLHSTTRTDGQISSYLRSVCGDDAFNDDDDPWLVSCHGDCWVNNMMFKYDDNDDGSGVPQQMMFVDWQLCREGCPSTDLAYMFYSSLTSDIRQGHTKDLLMLYCDTFVKTCRRCTVEPPDGFSLENLLKKFRVAKVFGLISATLILPIILSTQKEAQKNLDAPNAENGNGSSLTETFKKLTADSTENKLLTGRLVEILNELVHDGIL